MASIDERVVAMSFENDKFEAGVGTTMRTLGKLDGAIQNIGKSSGLDQLERNASRVTLAGPMAAVDTLKAKFSTLQAAAAVALGNIATMAAQKIGGIAKGLALDPITQGFQEYATNLSSIQTILANTQDSGGNLKTVNAALQELNKYSDQTIYNFGQMAKNIGTFTAAGVRLGPATKSIKGIANLAALSGSSAEQASTAMYQLSQAIASGHVSLQDWNSVVNAGMGGSVFQKALMRTATAMGTISDNAVKIDKATGKATVNGQSFRESIQASPGKKSWLTSDVLVRTLGQFTGDLSDAQLAAQGFNDEQIKAIQRTAQTAKKAATEVKTISGVFDVVKESIGSGWANTFQIIFGNFNESKKTFTDLSNFLQAFVSRTFKAFDGVLLQWKKLGGRTELIKGIKSAFDDLMAVLAPIREAFRDIFPAKTGQDLFRMTRNFAKLMEALKPSQATLRDLRRIFAGIFAVMHIGLAIVKGVAGVFFDLLGTVSESAGGFLDFAANIGDMLVNLDKTLTKGGTLTKFFLKLDSILKAPLKMLVAIGEAIGNLFGLSYGKGLDSFGNSLDHLNKKLTPFSRLVDAARKAWALFTHIMGKVKSALSPLLEEIATVIANFGQIVADGIKNANYDTIFKAINTVLLGGIFVAIKKAIGGGLKVDLGGGLVKRLSNTFGVLTSNLKSMQRNVQAKTLLAIAAALAVLAVAILLLTTVDPKKLASAMTALAVGMGELVGAMAILAKVAGGSAFIRMPAIAASLILLAGAMVIMAGAAKIFASMSWEEIARGLAGIAGSLAALAVATRLMSAPQLLAAGLALIPIAIALNLLATATKIFVSMSLEKIAKGLLAIFLSLVAIGGALELFPRDAILIGPALILIAVALAIMSGVVKAFGSMDLTTLARGIVAIAGALGAIGLAIDTIPPTIALQAVGLLVLAAALTAISGVVAIFGHMNLRTLARGILSMGAALVVLGVGLTAMSGTLPGALALTAAASAFAVLAPTLALMGQMSWNTIVKGLAEMAAIIAVLAVAGLVAGPALVALGLGLAAIGAGVALIGGGLYLFAKAVSLISANSIKAMAALVAAASLFIAAFPQMVINFVKGFLTILDEVVKLAPKIVSAFVTILGLLIDGIIKLAPKAALAVSALITAVLEVLNKNSEPMIKAGYQLLNNLLAGLANNIGPITDNVSLIIVNFLNALASHMPDIIAAGVNVLTSFITGITNQMPQWVTTVATLVTTFIANIASHIPEVIAVAGTLIAQFIASVASQLPKLISAGISIITNFLTGVQQSIPKIISKALDVATAFVTSLASGLVRLVNVGFHALINFMNGIAEAIRQNEPQVIAAGYNIASAIGEGMLTGLADIAPKLLSSVGNLAQSMIDKATGIFEIGSPSKVFEDIGKNLMLGLSGGIDLHAPKVNESVAKASHGAVQTAKKHLGKMPQGMENIDTKPVITPVLDLSQIRKDAPKIDKILKAHSHLTLEAPTSTAHATAISKTRAKAEKAAPVVHAPTVNYTQNNYSPESLSNIEIYRQTHNQIAQLRRVMLSGAVTK